MPSSLPHDIAVFIGRLQPLHQGHLALLQRALDSAPTVVVVIGSAFQARSAKNPFTWEERAALVRAAFPDADRQGRLRFVPVRDYYDEARWVAAVRQGVTAQAGPDARIALVGHFKDSSSSYLRRFPGWTLIDLERHTATDATALRDAYFGAEAATLPAVLQDLGQQMPACSVDFLRQFAQQPAYAALQEEWQALRRDRLAWAVAPYPPILVTVDALVRCQDRVLLIRRGRAPGKGLWALPGGFLEPRDTLWQSCLRELAEETAWPLDEAASRAALRAVQVFEHPDRSQRGRTLTHAHFLDLGDAPLPPVRGGDDAQHAEWVPVAQLTALEDQLFEDHFHLLDCFLGLLPAD